MMYATFNEYSATGEGTRVALAIAPHRTNAEALFKKNNDEFYWPGLNTVKFDKLEEFYRSFIPPAVLMSIINRSGVCYIEYHGVYYINCS